MSRRKDGSRHVGRTAGMLNSDDNVVGQRSGDALDAYGQRNSPGLPSVVPQNHSASHDNPSAKLTINLFADLFRSVRNAFKR